MASFSLSNIDLDSVPEGVTNPLDHVTQEQRQKMDALRAETEKWNLGPAELEFVDDMCLYRFLLGLQWDVNSSIKQLKETCDWRASYKPQEIRLKDVEKVAKQGYSFSIGRDKHSRPIVYLLMGKDTATNDEEGRNLKLKYIVYIMEQCIRLMPKGVYNLTWIIDIQGASLSLSTIKQMKDMFSKVGDYYTERLAMSFVCNLPWTLNILWNVVKSFMHKETVAKYQFAKSTDRDIFAKYIDLDQLITQFSGNMLFEFNFERMVQEEEEILKLVEARKK